MVGETQKQPLIFYQLHKSHMPCRSVQLLTNENSNFISRNIKGQKEKKKKKKINGVHFYIPETTPFFVDF